MALGREESEGLAKGKPGAEKRKASGASRVAPGISDFLAGEVQGFAETLTPYLPQEIVGGNIPHITGTEDEAVWNAASQACGTEKVHYTYTVDEGRVWYLACSSSSLASNPDSWCPLAAALPGNSEYWDQETVYLYEQEGTSSALRWDPDTKRMQVFLGASRTILPRIQSMDANFVTINASVAETVPWRNRALKTEKLARATAKMLVVSGMMVALLAVIMLSVSYMSVNLTKRSLDDVKKESEIASLQLVRDANSAMQSDTVKHMVRVQELLDTFSKVDGTLVRYDVTKGKVEWEAVIPAAYIQPISQKFRVKVDDSKKEKDGRIRITGTR